MTIDLNLFLTFVFSYSATDLFQPKWMKEEKKTYWLYLFQHALMDGLIIYMLTKNIPFFLITTLTHYVIDKWQIDNRNRVPDRIAHLIVWLMLSLFGGLQ